MVNSNQYLDQFQSMYGNGYDNNKYGMYANAMNMLKQPSSGQNSQSDNSSSNWANSLSSILGAVGSMKSGSSGNNYGSMLSSLGSNSSSGSGGLGSMMSSFGSSGSGSSVAGGASSGMGSAIGTAAGALGNLMSSDASSNGYQFKDGSVNNMSYRSQYAGQGMAAGSKVGGKIGSMFGPMGSLIGTAGGAVIGTIGGAMVGNSYAKQANILHNQDADNASTHGNLMSTQYADSNTEADAVSNLNKYKNGGVAYGAFDNGGQSINAMVDNNEIIKSPQGNILQAIGPNATDKILAKLQPGSKILSDTMQFGGKTYADLGKNIPAVQDKSKKILSDNSASPLDRSTAELNIKNANSAFDHIMDIQEDHRISDNINKFRKGIQKYACGGIKKYKDGGKVPYSDWLKTVPEDKRGDKDYDLEAAYNNLPYDQMRRYAESDAHLPDTYKKPNHMTFSNESQYSNSLQPGGEWSDDEISIPNTPTYTYKASPTNMQYHTKEEMQNYFNTYEKGNRVEFPKYADGGVYGTYNQSYSDPYSKQAYLQEMELNGTIGRGDSTYNPSATPTVRMDPMSFTFAMNKSGATGSQPIDIYKSFPDKETANQWYLQNQTAFRSGKSVPLPQGINKYACGGPTKKYANGGITDEYQLGPDEYPAQVAPIQQPTETVTSRTGFDRPLDPNMLYGKYVGAFGQLSPEQQKQAADFVYQNNSRYQYNNQPTSQQMLGYYNNPNTTWNKTQPQSHDNTPMYLADAAFNLGLFGNNQQSVNSAGGPAIDSNGQPAQLSTNNTGVPQIASNGPLSASYGQDGNVNTAGIYDNASRLLNQPGFDGNNSQYGYNPSVQGQASTTGNPRANGINAFKSIADYGDRLVDLAPYFYNMGRSRESVEQINPENFTNKGRAIADTYNPYPELKENRMQAAIARTQNAMTHTNSGADMAFSSYIAKQKADMDSSVWNKKNQYDNNQRSSVQSTNIQTEGQNNQIRQNINDINMKSRAKSNDFKAKAMQQLSEWNQRNRLDRNVQNNDNFTANTYAQSLNRYLTPKEYAAFQDYSAKNGLNIENPTTAPTASIATTSTKSVPYMYKTSKKKKNG